MITSLCWAPRGALKPAAKTETLSKEDMKEYLKNSSEGLGGDAMDEDVEMDTKIMDEKKVTGIAEELKMDDYDNEESGAQMFLAGASLTVFDDNTNDPYITNIEEDDSDEDEAVIKPSDFILLAGSTDQEYSTAEVHVYDKSKGAVYVHRDFVLPSFPLAVQYFNTGSEGKDETSNYVAVGTFEPAIEIWSLDVQKLEPVASLGGRLEQGKGPTKKSKKRKGKKKQKNAAKFKPGSHSLAVMSLDWNLKKTAALASGSADKTVKVWDLSTQECVSTFKHHPDKVQAVKWNPAEASVLLSGSYDRKCACIDVRDSKSCRFYKVGGDVNDISWNHHSPTIFAASTDNGTVVFYDIRKASGSQSKPLFTIGAHDEEVSSISFNAKYGKMLATGSADETVKIWDLSTKPVCVEKKEMKIGQIFALDFNSEDPDILAVGGSEGKVCIWDIQSSQKISNALKKKE